MESCWNGCCREALSVRALAAEGQVLPFMSIFETSSVKCLIFLWSDGQMEGLSLRSAGDRLFRVCSWKWIQGNGFVLLQVEFMLS